MSHIRTPMALVCIRKKGLGVAAQLHAGGPGIVVYPRRCPQCGYVELFSPNRPPAELIHSRQQFRRSGRVSKN